MREFIVYRHGASEAPGAPEKMAVARVQAGSAEEACRLASLSVAVTASQHLTAEPAEEVDAREANLNRRAEAL